MAIGVRVKLEDEARRDLQAAIADSPRRFLSLLNARIIPDAQKRIDAALNRPPGAVSLPFQFATEKSRRFYFANFQPPYRRTGNSQQWKLVMQSATGEVVEIYLENPSDYARYVFGNPEGGQQVPGHARTGWTNLAQQIPGQSLRLLHDVSAAWLEVAVAPLRKGS